MAAEGWNLEHSYATLPGRLFVSLPPTPVAAPQTVVFNRPLAAELGLDPDALESGDAAAVFSGNRLPAGARPLAQAYAGHQFGHFTNLGDGRALLLGEQVAPDGRRFDIQLKGSGPTPFSRSGDGRAALGPMLREYIISEALHALGIPTTRSLAVVRTGEEILRHRSLPGAILTRVASSHIRVGTFEWAAARRDQEALEALILHTLRRHYPDKAEAANPAHALFEGAAERQARLVAQWMLVGFVHGVMNTDNMALSGETIDYGPCAFMDAYDPATVFSSIDRRGRYAYGNQPTIAQWNLARLAEALLSQIHPDEKQAIALATEVIEAYPEQYRAAWLRGMRCKLGLSNERPEDAGLIEELLACMHRTGADFTNTFAALSQDAGLSNLPGEDEAFARWHARWRARVEDQDLPRPEALRLMRSCNPAFIPRNHKVEEALEAAENQGNLAPLQRLLDVLARPYDHHRDLPEYRQPPAPGEGVYQTFCGT